MYMVYKKRNKMSANVEKLLKLHSEGRSDDTALNKALNALNEPEKKPESSKAIENLRRRRREKNKRAQLAEKVIEDDTTVESNELKLIDKPLCNYFKTYEVDARKYKDPSILFNDKKSTMTKQIRKDIKEYNGIKFSIALSIKFYHDELNGEKKEVTGQKHGDQSAVLDDAKVNEFYDDQVAYLQTWIEKFTNTASGLEVDHCIKLYLNIAKYEPLEDSSYLPLPEALVKKKAIINVKNKDDRCLEWALKSAMYPAKTNMNNIYSYTKCPDLNMKGIDFPTPI